MFRINGDITRQLSKHYNVAFKEKYKKEIKERIIQYINHYIENVNMTFLEKLKYMEDKIKIQDNKIFSISYELFNKELFSIFNEEWMNIQTEKTYYTKKEERDMFNCFKQEMMIKTFNKYYYKDINQKLMNNFATNNRMENLEIIVKRQLSFLNYRKEIDFSLNNDELIKTKINYDFIKKQIKKTDYITKVKEHIIDLSVTNLYESYRLYQPEKGFLNYTIVMNTERALVIKEDMVEKIFNEDVVKKENKKRIVLLNKKDSIQFEEIEVGKKEIIAVGYENITNYIRLYITSKYIEEIENLINN